MDLFSLALLLAAGIFVLRKKEQRQRIALLGRHLGQYQIEKLMETLTDGYLRALGEADAERRQQIWAYLQASESQMCQQFARFCDDFSRLDAADTRVSTLPLALPLATRWLPQASFDARRALAIHADGLARAVANTAGRTPRNKAFTLSAELLLMQHTCHWFCNSRGVASARLLTRHRTSHAQVLAAVDTQTRQAYSALTGT